MCELSIYERTTDAQQYVEGWAEQDGYDDIDEYMEDSYIYYEFMGHGFIFQDGSLLDVTDGTDHRVIPIEEWEKYDILTYCWFQNGDMNIRIHNRLHLTQYEKLVEIYNEYGFSILYVDVYNGRNLKETNQIECYSKWSLKELTKYM